MSVLHIITQVNCVNCPAAKAVVEEAIAGTDVLLNIIDLEEMDPDFEFRLLENQVFIASTPSIILESNGTLKMLYTGQVPDIEDVRRAIGAS